MSVIQNENSLDQDSLLERISTLEKRLVKVESLLRLEYVGDNPAQQTKIDEEELINVDTAESNIIEYGLAWLGSVVFFFGIVFLMSYISSLGYPGLSRIVAYAATFLLLALAYFLRKTFSILTNVLSVCCSILFFYITTKLYYFTEAPIIAQEAVVIGLLFIIIALQLYHALTKQSELRGALAISFCIATAIFSDSAFITFPILTITAITTLVLFNARLWWKLHIYSLFMVYLGHLLWLIGNPVMGNKFGLVDSAETSLFFIFGYAIIYVISIYIPKAKLESNTVLVSITIWNALAFSLLMLAIIPKYYAESYIIIFAVIALICLLLSISLKKRAVRAFAPATYACFGFMALSVAIYGYAGLPNAYLLLVLESFLVVSMALWFRSKIIVVANAFLFVFILLAYLITSESLDSVNFAMAFTALATARILNWRKERLTLKGEIYRNTYLLIGCLMLLYSLNNILPSNYVTLAWTAVAFGFFILSIFLHNLKYRYLSILTIAITAGHLFFIDLGQMEIGYRVVAFIVFAVISLGLSLYYTKRMKKK
jgi:hypothetical protein